LIYLLDTNVVSGFFRSKPKVIGERLDRASLRGDKFMLSSLVYHELYFGALRSLKPEKNIERLLRFEAEFAPFVPVTRDDAEIAAAIRTHLAPRGEMIGPYDLLIAAQTLRTGATLVTANVREFARVPGLVFEDWSLP
jgi:tRNA(fMet)-specific endonuclease VapC